MLRAPLLLLSLPLRVLGPVHAPVLTVQRGAELPALLHVSPRRWERACVAWRVRRTGAPAAPPPAPERSSAFVTRLQAPPPRFFRPRSRRRS